MALTLEQKAIRRTGLGSSDIAAVVGKSPYASPFDVYLSKVEGQDFEGNFSTELGDLLEDAVLTLYERRAGPAELIRHPGTFRHPRLPFIVDSPDAIAHFDGERRAVEAKTSRSRDFDEWGEEGTDEVPVHYVIQGTWHLIRERAEDPSITRCDLPVLIATDEFRLYRIDFTEDLAGMLIEEGARFWRDHIEARKPPEIDGSKRAEEWLKKKFPRDSGPMLKATDADEELLRTYFAICEKHESLEERVKALKAQLQQRIGEASGLVGAAGQVTWKKAKDSEGTDWEALARTLLEKLPANDRTGLLQRFHTVKPGSRRFLKKPAKAS